MEVVVHPSPPLKGRLWAGGSKNYTSRYVLAATLAGGESVLHNPALIDDAQVMMDCCRRLGAIIEEMPDTAMPLGRQRVLRIKGTDGRMTPPGELNVGNAGAVARFLMAVAAHLPAPTRFVTPYEHSLGKRPHGDLLQALTQLGCSVSSNQGRLPVTIGGGVRQGGRVEVSGAISSQFTSALLFLAPLLCGETRITVTGEQVSKPLIGQTLRVLSQCGIILETDADLRHFVVPGPQPYRAGDYHIPGDWPGAAAIMAAAAVAGATVTIEGLYGDDGQGEQAMVEVLAAMGANITFDESGHKVTVSPAPQSLKAVAFDGDKATDAVMAMVAAACLAEGRSRFYNIENIRYKESDRISDYCRELRKLGVEVEEEQDAIVVCGRPAGYAGGVTLEGHNDHRLLMGLTVVALRCRQPVRLTGADHISKSYPAFFTDLISLGANIRILD